MFTTTNMTPLAESMIREAYSHALEQGSGAVRPGHLLRALLTGTARTVIGELLGEGREAMLADLDRQLRLCGAEQDAYFLEPDFYAQPGQLHFDEALTRIFRKIDEDEYIIQMELLVENGVEVRQHVINKSPIDLHVLLLGLASANTPASRVMAHFGYTRAVLLEDLAEMPLYVASSELVATMPAQPAQRTEFARA